MGCYVHTRLLGEISLELQRKEAEGRVRVESCSLESEEQCAEAQRWQFLLGVCRKQPWWARYRSKKCTQLLVLKGLAVEPVLPTPPTPLPLLTRLI